MVLQLPTIGGIAVLRVVVASFAITFAWNWFLLWVSAKIIDSQEGAWRNCAILTGASVAVAGVVIGFRVLGSIFHSFFFGLLVTAAVVAGIWFLARITTHVLDITFWNFVGLVAVIWGLNFFASNLKL